MAQSEESLSQRMETPVLSTPQNNGAWWDTSVSPAERGGYRQPASFRERVFSNIRWREIKISETSLIIRYIWPQRHTHIFICIYKNRYTHVCKTQK